MAQKLHSSPPNEQKGVSVVPVTSKTEVPRREIARKTYWGIGMKALVGIGLLGAFAIVAAPSSGNAVTQFDQNITPDVIFGSGNANGGFTTNRTNGIELGLRAKQRFPAANIFNSNGAGTYSHAAGVPSPGFSFAPDSPSTALWNFEWSVNVDFSGDNAGQTLDDFTFRIGIDFDPGFGTNFLEFDPINVAYADHALGDNSTPNGGGTVIDRFAADRDTQYAAQLASQIVAQNSWNMQFFDNAPLFPFDGNNDGQYEFFLAAFEGGDEVARTEISVIVGAGAIPEPGTLALFGVGIAGLGWLRRRRA